MAYRAVMTISCLVTLLLLQPMVARSDLLTPIISPFLDQVCNHVQCGRGTCKPNNSSTFFFECECADGWRQTQSGSSDRLKFLPCIIPNCTMDLSCDSAPSPAPDRSGTNNQSIFDPCYFVNCRGGSCNRKSNSLSYQCTCSEGYHNLLNQTAFPCYKECAIGVDCKNLGVNIANTSPPPAPGLSDNGNNQGSSIPLGHFDWLIVLVTSLALTLWK
ncbi:hypothetical protein K2173_015687 [Erythroxylum novogranatense]|uniref:Neurogenic locus notch-like protein n=1 Tax=Erythroxylum novogranatense TaxID=1862640 RepID=A0AAV8THT5_9ROSI|nr:hypothetical protein K2173_015687 [Erythroxylum novogranatense]